MSMIAAAHLLNDDVVHAGGHLFRVVRREERHERDRSDRLTYVQFRNGSFPYQNLPPSDPREPDLDAFHPGARYRSWDNALLLEVTNR